MKTNSDAAHTQTDQLFEDGYLHELLTMTSKKYPNKIALKDKTKAITYRAFFQAVQALAEQITCTDQPIGIVAHRNIETVIAIYAILQSGNYYIPIDPAYPEQRVSYIKTKTTMRAFLEDGTLSWIHDKDVIVPFAEKLTHGDRLAYIIFTSGSTGMPKGVVESHYQVMNTLRDLERRLLLTDEDTFLCLAAFNFGLSVFDLFGSGLVGGTVILAEDQRDFQAVKTWFETDKITIWNSVPGVLQNFLKEEEFTEEARNNLKACLLSGDYVSVELAQEAVRLFSNCQVYSLGGATECSIWSILYRITPENVANYSYIPYGGAMQNQQIHILDEHLQLATSGEMGQIAIGGKGVALGYIGEVEKTAKIFINHPELGNLNLTGDFGIYHEVGHVQFSGRIDSRVKFNGYRISLSEVSAAFYEHFELENQVLLVENDKLQNLVLIYLSDETLQEAKIREILRMKLAIYEMPSLIISVTSFPLTANGKVDREALKELATSSRKEISNHSEAMNSFRKMIASLLQVEHISASDSLFSLAANSLQLMKVKNWLKDTKAIEIELLDLYDCDTVGRLEQLITEKIIERGE